MLLYTCVLILCWKWKSSLDFNPRILYDSEPLLFLFVAVLNCCRCSGEDYKKTEFRLKTSANTVSTFHYFSFVHDILVLFREDMFSIEYVVASHMSYIHWYPEPFCCIQTQYLVPFTLS
jgi:hypothetical protein